MSSGRGGSSGGHRGRGRVLLKELLRRWNAAISRAMCVRCGRKKSKLSLRLPRCCRASSYLIVLSGIRSVTCEGMGRSIAFSFESAVSGPDAAGIGPERLVYIPLWRKTLCGVKHCVAVARLVMAGWSIAGTAEDCAHHSRQTQTSTSHRRETHAVNRRMNSLPFIFALCGRNQPA